LALRVAILSDIHGNQIALEAALADLKQAGGAEKVWVLGDLCAVGPRPVECLQMVREIPNVQVISGNTDRYVLRGTNPFPLPKDEASWKNLAQRLRNHTANFAWTTEQLSWADAEYLGKLPGGLDLHVPDYGWVVGYHGSPGDDEYILLPDTPAEEVLDQFLDAEGRLGFGGHTHIPMDRDLDRWRVVNVGSVGLPRNEEIGHYALVEFNGGEVRIDLRTVSFDIDKVSTDLKQRGHPAAERITQLLHGKWDT